MGKKHKVAYPTAKIEDIEPEWERRFQEAEPLRRMAWWCILRILLKQNTALLSYVC